MSESEKTPLLVGVEITHEKLRQILDLPENTVMVTNDLLKNKGLMKRFVRKYLYLFRTSWEKRAYVANWAIAYKRENTNLQGYDLLPYGDAYPEVIPILYLAWGFGLVATLPEMGETAMFRVILTLKGRRVYKKVVKDMKKGRPTDYPIGKLRTEEDALREWQEIQEMLKPSPEAMQEAARQATKALMHDHGFYDYEP